MIFGIPTFVSLPPPPTNAPHPTKTISPDIFTHISHPQTFPPKTFNYPKDIFPQTFPPDISLQTFPPKRTIPNYRRGNFCTGWQLSQKRSPQEEKIAKKLQLGEKGSP